jgi:hypothetical protein
LTISFLMAYQVVVIPLQYVTAEELVQFFRVPDPFGFKGSGSDEISDPKAAPPSN